jgi:hypothetical protein
MTTTLERPPAETPHAGVIEEARAIQRRQRRAVATAALATGLTAALLINAAGGGQSHRASVRGPGTAHPLTASRVQPASCRRTVRRLLQGPPSKSLLSILGVLRRPASSADQVPLRLQRLGAAGNAFVHYVRRTRSIGGASYYIYPAVISGCGTHARQGMMHLDANVEREGSATDGGGASAAAIEQGKDIATGPPGSPTSSTLTMLVPDGVATVRVSLPAGPASGYSAKISPAVTITTTPSGNEVIARLPRSIGGGAIRRGKITWIAADGRVLRAFDHPE